VSIRCGAPPLFPEGELHQRKLRLDKYKPLAGCLLEFYESGSSVEVEEDTDAEDGIDPDVGGAVKSRHRTRSTVGKKTASAVAAAISVVKVAEQKKKKRKRRVASPPALVTPSIPTPRSLEVMSEEEEDDEAVEELAIAEDQLARRPESPAAKR
jgi:hypothetical protein